MTVTRTPQQNGVAKRKNQTIDEMARSMLNDKKFPNDYWAKAMAIDVHMLNISPTKAMRNITTYEAWFYREPTVSHLKVFECIAYGLIDESDQGKMNKKSEKCIFIGYSIERKGYQLYNLEKNKLISRRNVAFNESCYWNWDEKSMNEKVKNTSQGVNFDPLLSKRPLLMMIHHHHERYAL